MPAPRLRWRLRRHGKPGHPPLLQPQPSALALALALHPSPNPKPKPDQVNPRFYGELWSLLGRPAGKRSPSTGLLAIALALGVCGRVSLYGFSAPTERRGRCERHYWECPAWAEQQSYHEPKHAFHSWSSEVRLREEWRASGLVDDGPSTYGPGEAGAAAVRAADPRNGSAARRQRWVALSQGRGAQERPGSTGSRARSRRRRIVARGPPSVEAARRA